MTVTSEASAIYAFSERTEAVLVDRVEIAHPQFSALRFAVRELLALLRVDDGSVEVASALHGSLLRWLSVPLPFADIALAPDSYAGSLEQFRRRWGAEAAALLDRVLDLCSDLRQDVSPLRQALDDYLIECAAACDDLRIYCHRTARDHFISLPSWADIIELAHVDFIGTSRDYRTSPCFDVLVKVGPLRARGISSIPGAVLNSPRYSKLTQLVWAGTQDEDGFGEDPVSRALAPDTLQEGASCSQAGWRKSAIDIRRQTTVRGDLQSSALYRNAAVDDFDQWFGGTPDVDSRSCVLLHLAGGLGCLHSPHSDVLCVSTQETAVHIERLEPSAIDGCTTHIVDPSLRDVDLGDVKASEGRYAPLWKSRLQAELSKDSEALTSRLHAAGLRLRTLKHCLAEWLQESTTVIHAPKQRRHFDILITALGIEQDSLRYPRPARLTWSAAAWVEISRSRGDAIQHGAERQEILLEELSRLLNDEMPSLAPQIRHGHSLTWSIPVGRTLTGSVTFHALLDVEEGFRSPDRFHRKVQPLSELLRWRA